MVVPQNAADIIRNDDYELDAESDRYFAAISAIGQEDLYYNETTPQPLSETEYTLEQLREFPPRNKPVLVTDYIIKASNPDAQANAARSAGLRIEMSYRRLHPIRPHAPTENLTQS